MSKYEVRLYEKIVHTVWVNAENETDAYALAEKQYFDGEDNYLDNVEAYNIESLGSDSWDAYEIPE